MDWNTSVRYVLSGNEITCSIRTRLSTSSTTASPQPYRLGDTGVPSLPRSNSSHFRAYNLMKNSAFVPFSLSRTALETPSSILLTAMLIPSMLRSCATSFAQSIGTGAFDLQKESSRMLQ